MGIWNKLQRQRASIWMDELSYQSLKKLQNHPQAHAHIGNHKTLHYKASRAEMSPLKFS